MCLGLDGLRAEAPRRVRLGVPRNPVSICSLLSCPAGNRAHATRPSHHLRTRSYSALAVYVLLATAIFLSTSASSRADVEPKRILMLHSFGLRFKPWTDFAQIIRSEITRNAQRPVDFQDHSLLNARLNDEKSDGPFVDYLHALYAEKPPDLIVAIGAPAANFVQRYRRTNFSGNSDALHGRGGAPGRIRQADRGRHCRGGARTTFLPRSRTSCASCPGQRQSRS